MASTDTTFTPNGSNWFAYRPAQGKSVYVSGTWGITTNKPDAMGFVLQIRRDGVDVTGDAVVTLADGVLTIESGASDYTKTADDVAHWVAF